ncbi:hypothetical protein TVAG_160380 [Trichomonas vaginalis G3]|uniref:HECT domain-containing protein n=1 Tax=Trichomonas vaginalis (strain ATCC PRA-98 / G3) TaxID=412133 RepID=A2DUY0_TRIV3|nr:negative regulation of histone ubiquitination [Trichomonas vaginalis G3]EAY15865.1 hypothetical protein TVAG_160380 [Trichomonas vaginalis G3]KAI5524966.1 negative regulation of histone ubiquitination [Trichomonas vaginalis G3]|eukprot:XP_001328088.1 hypothetical protein [Trichomonas vaginalis G3]
MEGPQIINLLLTGTNHYEILENVNLMLLDPQSAQIAFRNCQPEAIFTILYQNISSKVYNDNCVQLAIRIISNVIQNLTSSISFFKDSSHIIDTINLFLETKSSELRIDIAQILEIISIRIPYALCSLAQRYLQTFVEQLMTPDENLVHKSITRVIKNILNFNQYSLNFSDSTFILLVNYTNQNIEGEVRANLVSILKIIAKKDRFTTESYNKLIYMIRKTNDSLLIQNMIKYLKYQLKINQEQFINIKFPYKELLIDNAMLSKSSDIQKSVIQFINWILEIPLDKLSTINDKIREIQNVLMHVLCYNPLHPLITFKTLGMTLQIRLLDISKEFIAALYNYSNYIPYCGFVAYICHWCYTNPEIYYSCIYINAMNTYFSGPTPVGSLKISQETINLFSKQPKVDVPDTLNEIYELFRDRKVHSASFMYKDFLNKSINLVKTDNSFTNYKEFSNLLLELLGYVCFDRVSMWEINSYQFLEFLSTERSAIYKSDDGGLWEISYKPYESCLTIFGKVINYLQPMTEEEKRKIIGSKIWSTLRYENVEDMQNGLQRFIQALVDAKPLSLFVNNKLIYNVFTTYMVDVLMDQSKSPLEMETTRINFNLQKESKSDMTEITNVTFYEKINPNLQNLLDLLKIINEKEKIQQNEKVEEFVRKVENQMKFVGHTIPKFNSSINIVYNYSFLFPLNLRLLVLRLILNQPFDKLVSFNNYYKMTDNQNIFVLDSALKMVFERNNLFQKVKEISFLFENPLPIDIQFEGEQGSGRGPTKEFFQVFFKEIALSKQFRMIKSGYFPSPFSDSDEFYLIGVFSAKMILMDSICGLTLSKFFLKMVFDENVTISDTDSDILENLSNKDYYLGLDVPYCFPGIMDAKLNEKYEIITSENIDDYVNDVKSHILSQNVLDSVQKFKEGFCKVFDIQIMKNLFSAEEFSDILCGEETQQITTDKLNQYCIVELGYSKESNQFKWLCEFVESLKEKTKLFVKFVTGNDLLPIGGISALNPQIRVIKMDEDIPDKYFPSASTCSNLLKIPEYSSKEVFFAKMMDALYMGNERFDLV